MKTALYDRHCALQAKIVDFAGWRMPLQYTGIIHEHLAVRQRAGLFDVSHMGRVLVKGPDAEKLLDYLSTNAILGKTESTATYTAWCSESGGCVDDLIVYKKGPEDFFIIVNASNRVKDLEHLNKIAASYDARIQPKYEDGILALQGPNAKKIAAKIFKEAEAPAPMHLSAVDYHGEEIIISSTGYTGSGGFEIMGSAPAICDLWDSLLKLGKEEGIQPVGLGARDTLRLEMGYALYGHELSDKIAPTESVSAWTVKWKKGDFLGRRALEELESSSGKRHQYGILMDDKAIPRQGYEVFYEGKQAGLVTSGGHAPSLNRPIAIILVERNLEEGNNIQIMIRGKACSGKVVKLPFYKGE